MLGNFFNSFYYGKAGKGDFNPENLPTNRVQLFFEMLRVRWSALMRLNLLYILFWIPAILWSLLNLMTADNVLAMAEAGEILESDVGPQLIGLVRTWLLFLFPCIAITGPATAGVSYVTRNWARDQHSFMFSDFKDAMKENWKQALIVSTITGLLPLVVFTSYYVYGGMSSQYGIFFIIPQVIVVLVGFLWLLSQQMIYTLIVTYKLSLKNLFRNSFLLSVGKLPLSVGIRLISLILPAICVVLLMVIPSITIYALLVLILYFVVFGFAFNRFLYASYANALCEKYVNPHIEGAAVGMGLRQTTEDDYEIDPTMPQPSGAIDQSQE